MWALIKRIILTLIPKFVKEEIVQKEVKPFLEKQLDKIMLSDQERERHRYLVNLNATAKTEEERRKYVQKLRDHLLAD